jgi:5-methyltetrahydrofolate--homocysteine methyltransferase
MTPADLLTRLAQAPLLLDGGLGTMLIAMGLAPGEAPERWVLNHPARIIEAHLRYVRAGSNLIHTATFGATPIRLAAVGLDGKCAEVNARAVAIAREAAGRAVLVAGDIGPTGIYLPPRGDAREQDLFDSYAEQVRALQCAGVDLISIETMYDLREAQAALRAAHASGLAVVCSMTFDIKPHGIFTFAGDALDTSLASLHEHGATVVGFNCTVTSDSMLTMVEQASSALAGVPIVAQPNAGQPVITSGGIYYEADPDAFGRDLARMVAVGARMVGGCCGTDDTFIRAARSSLEALAGRESC